MDAARIAYNLARLLESINKTSERLGVKEVIKLVVVSKQASLDELQAAYDAGARDFGESRVSSLVDRAGVFDSKNQEANWHFIGRLQTNKINQVIRARPALLHSLHSFDLALALQRRLEKQNLKLDSLLQLNPPNEDSKQGLAPSLAIETYERIQYECPHINLRGIMCIGAHIPSGVAGREGLIAKGFSEARVVFEKLQSKGARILSMGMSSDYEIALAEGSNCLRIGSQIFGG